jgi:hypothetical protein
MPRYFFHVHDDQDIPDQLGTVLAGPKEAQDEAVVAAGEMLESLDGRFWNAAEWRMDVVDEAGASVCSLRISGKKGAA